MPKSHISTKSIFDKHESSLGNNSSKYTKNIISSALKIAYGSKMIERIDDKSAPEWFKKLDTVVFWQSQLRGSRFKNSTRENTNTTKTQYLHQVWKFNKWLAQKTFTINTFQVDNGNSFTQKTESRKFRNVEELLRILEQPFADQKNVTRIIKQYLLDELHTQKKASYMLIIAVFPNMTSLSN